MSRVNVSIQQVVLRGFEAADRAVLLESLQAELRQVIADAVADPAWARPNRTQLLNLGRLPFSGGPSAARDLGRRIARGIGKGLKHK